MGQLNKFPKISKQIKINSQLYCILLRQSASALVAVPPCSVLCAEFESDSLIGDRYSVTGVAFELDRSGKLVGMRATPAATLIGCEATTFGMDVRLSFAISTGATLKRLSLSVLFDGVASGVGMRAFWNSWKWNWLGQSILKWNFCADDLMGFFLLPLLQFVSEYIYIVHEDDGMDAFFLL